MAQRKDNDSPRAVGTIHEAALEVWGAEAQMKALAEELCEAAAATLRALNGKGTLAEVREELVDVESLRLSLVDVLGTPLEWRYDTVRKRGKLAAKIEATLQDDPEEWVPIRPGGKDWRCTHLAPDGSKCLGRAVVESTTNPGAARCEDHHKDQVQEGSS